MTTDERALGKLATHMDAAERATLLAAMTPLDVPAGAVIARDGEPLDALHVVVSGGLTLSIGDVELGRLSPGSFFGELAILDQTLAGATATAVEPTRLLRFARKDLDALRTRHTRVASLLLRALVEDLAERVRDANTVAEPETIEPKRGFLEGVLARLFGGGNA